MLAEELDRTGDIDALQAEVGNFRLPDEGDADVVAESTGFESVDFAITERFGALGVGWSGIGPTPARGASTAEREGEPSATDGRSAPTLECDVDHAGVGCEG